MLAPTSPCAPAARRGSSPINCTGNLEAGYYIRLFSYPHPHPRLHCLPDILHRIRIVDDVVLFRCPDIGMPHKFADHLGRHAVPVQFTRKCLADFVRVETRDITEDTNPVERAVNRMGEYHVNAVIGEVWRGVTHPVMPFFQFRQDVDGLQDQRDAPHGV